MLKYYLVLLIVILSGCKNPGVPVVSADFPGGNIVVLEVKNDTILVTPDLSEIQGEWFYWYFKLSNIAGRKLTIKFNIENQFTSFGPAFSINDNRHWEWYGGNRVNNNSFTISFAKEDTTAYFCTAIPYTEVQFNEFINKLANVHTIETQILTTTQEGRAVEALLIPSINSEPSARVLLTARHHACEMMASYVMEGIIESLLNDPELEILREQVEFMIIPFIDKDGVENGEQGKNRLPRDHNRDYEDLSLYAATAALRENIPAWADGKLKVALDLHCPWIHGKYNEWIYLVGDADSVIEKEQLQFSCLLEKNNTGELKFRSKDFLPFNTAWNTDRNNSKGKTFAQWAGSIENIQLASTIEFPYGNVLGTPVTIENAREFGHALAQSISIYLEN